FARFLNNLVRSRLMIPFHTYSDDYLFSLVRQDDEQAFTELYQRYWKLLFSVAANKLNNLTDAEEIVQEVFADLWKRRKVIEFTHSLKSFLAAATKYQVFTLMAKRQRERKSAFKIDPVVSDLEEIEAKDLFEKLQSKIEELPEQCRLVYELSRNDGYSHQE